MCAVAHVARGYLNLRAGSRADRHPIRLPAGNSWLVLAAGDKYHRLTHIEAQPLMS